MPTLRKIIEPGSAKNDVSILGNRPSNLNQSEQVVDDRVQDRSKHRDEDKRVNLANSEHQILQTGTFCITRPPKGSRFIGVYHVGTRYQARITQNKKQLFLGQYELESDAAHAHDFAAMKFDKHNRGKNFHTTEEYERERKHELELTGISTETAGTIADAERKIQKRFTRINHPNEEDPQANHAGGIFVDNFKSITKNGRDASNSLKRTFRGQDKYKDKKRCADALLHPGTTAAQLNTKTDLLTQKWGSFFVDREDWQWQTDIQSHQREINKILISLRNPNDGIEGNEISYDSTSPMVTVEEDFIEVQSTGSEHVDTNAPHSPSNSIASMSKILSNYPASTMIDTDDNNELEERSKFDSNIVEHCEASHDVPSDSVIRSKLPSSDSNVVSNTHDNHEVQDQLGLENIEQSKICPIGGFSTTTDRELELHPTPPFTSIANNNTGDCLQTTHEVDKIIENDKDIENNSFRSPATSPQDSMGRKSGCGVPKTNSIRSGASVNKFELVPLNPGQINTLSFPTGCSVWSNFVSETDGEMFKSGKVIRASFNLVDREIYYEVLVDDNQSFWLQANKLAYAPMSPIYYSQSSSNKEGSLEGEIVMCRTEPNGTSFYYTAVISSDSKLKVISDIPSGQIYYRKGNTIISDCRHC